MAQQVINVGTVANDRTGDDWRDAWIKQNSNNTELYSAATILTNDADVKANGTTVGGVTTLNAGTYLVLGDINLGTDRIDVPGGILILGNSSSESSITTSSSLPTITFKNGFFQSSAIMGRLGIRVNNTGGGPAFRIQDFGTVAFIDTVITTTASTGVEINNATGVSVKRYRMESGVTNGAVMTGAANSSPIFDDFNTAAITGKAIDFQGTITSGTARLTNLVIGAAGVGFDMSGSMQGLFMTGVIGSTADVGMKISGTVSGVVDITATSISSATDEAIDIQGGLITTVLMSSSFVTSTGAGKSAMIADAAVSGSNPNITDSFTATVSRFFPGAGGTALTGISKKDINVVFQNNGNTVTDSTTLGCFTLDTQSVGARTTTISVQGNDGAITAYADAGGGSTTVTSVGHPINNGDPVAIIGTVAYNGLFTAAAVTANTFDIVRAFVTDEATGNWESGWVKIAGATTDCPTIERFQGSADNELEYLASPTIPVTYSAIIGGEKSGAAVQAYQFAVFCDIGTFGFVKINGSIGEDFTNRVSTIPVRIPSEVKTGDKFTAHVRNIDAATDFICDTLTVDIAFS